MSEPVPNVDIEDVLSSIRRLVSDDNRPAPKPEPESVPQKPTRLVLTPSLLVAEPEAEPAQVNTMTEEPATPVREPASTESDSTDRESAAGLSEASDLASDLEVEETADPWVELSDTEFQDVEQDGDQDSETDDLQLDTGAGSEPKSDGFASPTPVPSANEPEDQPEDQPEIVSDQETPQTPWADPEATLFEAAETAETTENPEEAPEEAASATDVADSPHHDDEVELNSGSDARTSETALVEDDFLDDPQEDTYDLAADSPDSPDLPDAETPEVTELNLSEVAEAAETQPEPGDDAQSGPDDQVSDSWASENRDTAPDMAETPFEPVDADEPYSTATLGAKIAALEAQIAQTKDQWEPDGELGDDYAGTQGETLEWQDHDAEPKVVPRRVSLDDDPAPDASQTDAHADADQSEPGDAAREMADIMGGDDAILDEESLRELVSDIVRQELQGALGERITRNVRKLVRREIHRALTAQELE